MYYIYISYVTATNMLVSLVLIPQTEMARYHQGGEVSVFNQTQSHHQLQRMLPEGAHSLGKPTLFVCLHWWKIGFMRLHPIKIKTDNNRNVAIYKFITLYLSLTVVGNL